MIPSESVCPAKDIKRIEHPEAIRLTAGLQTSCVLGGFWSDAQLGTAGSQAEAVRVPLADGTLVKAPVDANADDALLASLLTLSDVYGTGWHAAVRGGVTAGSTVTVIGDGAVALSSLFGPNVTLTGGPAPVRAYIEQQLPAVLDGTVVRGRVFDRTMSLAQTPKAYTAMDTREALKVAVHP